MKTNIWVKIKTKIGNFFEAVKTKLRYIKYHIQKKIHSFLDKTLGAFVRNKEKRRKFFKRRVVLFLFFSFLYWLWIGHVDWVLNELYGHLTHRYNMKKKHDLMVFFMTIYPLYLCYFLISSLFVSIYIDTHRAYRMFGCIAFFAFEEVYAGAFDMFWDVWFGNLIVGFFLTNITYWASNFLEFSDEDQEEEIENPEGYFSDVFHQNKDTLQLKVNIFGSEEDFYHNEEEEMSDYRQVYRINNIDEAEEEQIVKLNQIFGNNEDSGEQLLSIVIRMRKHNQRLYPELEPFLRYGEDLDMDLLQKQIQKKMKEAGRLREYQLELILNEAEAEISRSGHEAFFNEFKPYKYQGNRWFYFYYPLIEEWILQPFTTYVVGNLRSIRHGYFFDYLFGRRKFIIGPYSLYFKERKPVNVSSYIKNLKDPVHFWQWIPFYFRWVTWYCKKLWRVIWNKNLRFVFNPIAFYNELKWDKLTYKVLKANKKLLRPSKNGPLWTQFFDKHKQDFSLIDVRKFRKYLKKTDEYPYDFDQDNIYLEEVHEEQQIKKKEKYPYGFWQEVFAYRDDNDPL